MKTDAIIDIKGLQSMDEFGSDEVSLTTEGRFYRRAGSYYIMYQETEVTGFEGCRTTVKSAGDMVTVTRSGKYPSSLTFQPGQRHLALYNTAYGALTIATVTKSLESTLTDEGGAISVEYDVEVENAYVSSNTLTINVRPVNTKTTERN